MDLCSYSFYDSVQRGQRKMLVNIAVFFSLFPNLLLLLKLHGEEESKYWRR